jgi:hypothetical protein
MLANFADDFEPGSREISMIAAVGSERSERARLVRVFELLGLDGSPVEVAGSPVEFDS